MPLLHVFGVLNNYKLLRALTWRSVFTVARSGAFALGLDLRFLKQLGCRKSDVQFLCDPPSFAPISSQSFCAELFVSLKKLLTWLSITSFLYCSRIRLTALQIFVRAFDADERLVGVAFIFVGVYVTSLRALKKICYNFTIVISLGNPRQRFLG